VVPLQQVLVLVRERRLDQERARAPAAAEVTLDRVVRRRRTGAVHPVDPVHRDHVAVDVVIKNRGVEAADPGPDLHVAEVFVADVVDEGYYAPTIAGVVPGGQAAARGDARPRAVARRRRAEDLRLPWVHHRVELLGQVLRLSVGEVHPVVVAAVAGWVLEVLRDCVLVARHPYLDVRADRPEREVLEVLDVLHRVQRRPEATVADDGRADGLEPSLSRDLRAGQRGGLDARQLLCARLHDARLGRRRRRPSRPRLRRQHDHGRDGEQDDRTHAADG
jgi:hypothetical protein